MFQVDSDVWIDINSFYDMLQNLLDEDSLWYVKDNPEKAAKAMGFTLEQQHDGTLATGAMDTIIVPISAVREYFFITMGADPDSKVVVTDYKPDGEKIGSNTGSTNVALSAMVGMPMDDEYRFEIFMKETEYNTCRYVFSVYSREIPHHTIN